MSLWVYQPLAAAVLIQSAGDITAPTAPTTVNATAISATQVDVTWSGATDDTAVTNYEIYRDTILVTTLGAVSSYSDTGRTPSTLYSYTIKAKDAAGNTSSLSSAATATTPADTTNPTAPTVSATPISSIRIDLSWSGATDNVAVTNYEIYRGGVLITTVGAVSAYTDSPLTPNTLYSYTLKSKDAAGNVSSLSTAATATTAADTTAPTAPTSVSATAISSIRIDLSWVAGTDDIGVTGYDIYRDGGLIAMVGVVTAYTDSPLVPSTLYSYTLKTRDAAGNTSAFSSPAATATTQAGAAAGSGAQGTSFIPSPERTSFRAGGTTTVLER